MTIPISSVKARHSNAEYAYYNQQAENEQRFCDAASNQWEEISHIHGRIISAALPTVDLADQQALQTILVVAWVCKIVGALVFAALTTAAMDSSLRWPAFFVTLAAGYLISRIFLALVVFGTGADPRNPAALPAVRKIAVCAAVSIVFAIALLCWLRFAVSDSTMIAFSIIAACFEIGCFALGASAEAAYLVRSWSVDLPRAYSAAAAKRDRLKGIALSCNEPLVRAAQN